METIRLQVTDFPEDLHRDLKAAAAMDGKTMRLWVIGAIKDKLNRQFGKNPESDY
jgi:predicted HicB family RNase H-like nuclease